MSVIATLAIGAILQCRTFQGAKAISADGLTTVVVQKDFKVLVYQPGSDKPRFTGYASQAFHHGNLILSPNADQIVFLDEYAGVQVFDGQARHLKKVGPANCMTEKELENRYGKWSCHLEGKWIMLPKLRFTREAISLNIYTGRTVNIQLKG